MRTVHHVSDTCTDDDTAMNEKNSVRETIAIELHRPPRKYITRSADEFKGFMKCTICNKFIQYILLCTPREQRLQISDVGDQRLQQSYLRYNAENKDGQRSSSCCQTCMNCQQYENNTCRQATEKSTITPRTIVAKEV